MSIFSQPNHHLGTLKVSVEDNLSVLRKDNQQNAQLVLFCGRDNKIVLLTFALRYFRKKDSVPNYFWSQNLL